MSFSDHFETALLNLLFRNSDITNIGDATGLVGSTAVGDFWIALHSANPGEPSTQQTNEIFYTSYARVSVVRGPSGWTVTGNQVTNAALVQFPTCTGSTATATHFSVGVDNGLFLGVDTLVAYGALASPLTITSGIQPQFAAGSLVLTLD
ncbi:MAG: hypothetical protein ACK52I_06995 [Pseudomonadota bacterium]